MKSTSTRGRRAYVQIDPLGATIIAICIILVWAHTVYGESLRTLHPRQGAPADFAAEQFTFLAGIAAPVEYQNLVTYKASHLVSLLLRLLHRPRLQLTSTFPSTGNDIFRRDPKSRYLPSIPLGTQLLCGGRYRPPSRDTAMESARYRSGPAGPDRGVTRCGPVFHTCRP